MGDDEVTLRSDCREREGGLVDVPPLGLCVERFSTPKEGVAPKAATTRGRRILVLER